MGVFSRPASNLGGFNFKQGTPWQNMERGVAGQNTFINNAADAQLKGIDEALATIKQQYGEASKEYQTARDQAFASIESGYAPYKGFGEKSIRSLEDLISDPSSIRQSPGYQFGLDESRRQTESSAAARGSVLSGRTLKELSDRAQGYQDQFYGNEFARRMGTAQMGYGMDTDYTKNRLQTTGMYADKLANLSTGLGHGLADLQTSRGSAEADRWKNFSQYLNFHEKAGMEEASNWSSMAQGMMGGGGGFGGGKDKDSGSGGDYGGMGSGGSGGSTVAPANTFGGQQSSYGGYQNRRAWQDGVDSGTKWFA